MIIWNKRYQHPVGQGFFHSGFLRTEDKKPLTYVYDCGALRKYAKARDREIDKYLGYLKRICRIRHDRPTINILYISHLHDDHVNGLEQLLDPKSGAKVDTIILPLINNTDRLIAFARTAALDSSAAQSDFYREFIVDPVSALKRYFNPRQIIQMSPGSREDGENGAPGRDERPIEPLDGSNIPSSDQEKGGTDWKLVGRINDNSNSDDSGIPHRKNSRDMQYEIPDTAAISISSSKSNWLLAPYVDPTVCKDRDKFLVKLAQFCGVQHSEIESWLKDSSKVCILVTQKRKQLAGVYRAIRKDLNITSLSLYSGPASEILTSHDQYVCGCYGREAICGCLICCKPKLSNRIAWLATGDAALKDKKRREKFLTHYGQLLNNVHTITLPHHGSDHSFHQELLSEVCPKVCVAAADFYKNWKHPGPYTVQEVCSFGASLQVVTSNECSQTMECGIWDSN